MGVIEIRDLVLLVHGHLLGQLLKRPAKRKGVVGNGPQDQNLKISVETLLSVCRKCCAVYI
jgi:hypothetical protein